jgi:hypothetical protein
MKDDGNTYIPLEKKKNRNNKKKKKYNIGLYI